MNDRAGRRQDRKAAHGRERAHENEHDRDRFSGAADDERASAGDAAEFERGDWSGSGTEQAGEWRAGYAYGVGGYGGESPEGGSTRRQQEDFERMPRGRAMRSGYGEQGFGAGESHGGNWGGGRRGGYGGGEPGGFQGTRGSGWAAAGERDEQGRGPRSYGPDGWGGYAPRTRSEFAGRGEFGTNEPGAWNDERGYSTAGSAPAAWPARDRWNVPGPHSGRGPEGYRRSETAIRDDVCERLTRHGDLDASRIAVRVENGEVILEGFVDSRPSKRMAEDTAETVAGVRDVHNRLRIEERNDVEDRMGGRSR